MKTTDILQIALATARRTRTVEAYEAARRWAYEAAGEAPYLDKFSAYSQIDEIDAMIAHLQREAAARSAS